MARTVLTKHEWARFTDLYAARIVYRFTAEPGDIPEIANHEVWLNNPDQREHITRELRVLALQSLQKAGFRMNQVNDSSTSSFEGGMYV